MTKEKKEYLVEGEPTEPKAVSVRSDTSPALADTYLNIKGLEDVPVRMMPLPIVKVVHPTTTGAIDRDGVAVPTGHFFNTSTGQSFEELKFHIIRSKPAKRTFKDKKTGESTVKEGFVVLGAVADTLEIFAMFVTGTSFWMFRQLLGQIKGSKVVAVWEPTIRAYTEMREGDYGRYIRTNFAIIPGEPIGEAKFDDLSQIFLEYGPSINDAPVEVEEAEENEAGPLSFN